MKIQLKKRSSFRFIYNNYVKENGFKNYFTLSKFCKVTLSICLDSKIFLVGASVDDSMRVLYYISGQRPVAILARKSVSNFKIRKGFKIGAKVTLRKQLMFEFLERLCRIYLPRIRNFKGIKRNSINDSGITFGINDMSAFVELPSLLSMTKMGLAVSILITKPDGVSKIKKDNIYNFLRFFNFPIF